MNPSKCRGRSPGTLMGVEYAVYNVLAQYPEISTSRITVLLSGHRDTEVRDAVRFLKSKGLIYKSGLDSSANALWKVKS